MIVAPGEGIPVPTLGKFTMNAEKPNRNNRVLEVKRELIPSFILMWSLGYVQAASLFPLLVRL